MIALQSGAPFYNPEQLESVCSRLACSFDAVRPFLAPVPTYAGGMLALVAGGEGHKALRPPIETLRAHFDRLRPNTGYYTPEVHRAAFTLSPAFTPAPTRLAKPEVPSQPAPVCPALYPPSWLSVNRGASTMLDAIILLLGLAIVFSRSKARKNSYQGWLIRAP